jgi:undecaprenyl phosphate N,N'-diacetylbacillosamine 1-phosphate transferase
MIIDKGPKRAYALIKRCIDTLAALVLLMITLPILVATAIAIKLASPGPIFFRQERPGKDEKIFNLYKFRTMKVELSENGRDLSATERLTKIGIFLRKTSIDELPQLLNILRQDMSFIGPRPLLVRYLPYYSEAERKRHTIRPGISGWAQVNGRNTLSWEEKFRYDLEYVNNYSFFFDLKIACLTMKKLFQSSEVIPAGTTQSTMALDKERKEMRQRNQAAQTGREMLS